MSVSVLSKVGFSGRREKRDLLLVVADATRAGVFPTMRRQSYAWIVSVYRWFVPLEKAPTNYVEACQLIARHTRCSCGGTCVHCHHLADDIWSGKIKS